MNLLVTCMNEIRLEYLTLVKQIVNIYNRISCNFHDPRKMTMACGILLLSYLLCSIFRIDTSMDRNYFKRVSSFLHYLLNSLCPPRSVPSPG